MTPRKHNKYVQIAEHYRQMINSGELAPGAPMPSLTKVVEEFGVAITTANRAYRMLREEGLTVARAGVGTIVAPSGSPTVTDRVRAFAATGRALEQNEESRIVAVGREPASEEVASRVGVEPGTLVHYRRRILTRDGIPRHVSTSYYSAYVVQAAPKLADPESTGGSREYAAEQLGVAQDTCLSEITARTATKREVNELGLTEGSIVLQLIRTVHLRDGRVVEVAVKVSNASTPIRVTEKL